MSQRRPDPTKWVWCVLVLSTGPIWGPVSSVTVRPPENIPSTIEAQAKFFQDFFSVQLSPYKIEFGHVCEDPNTWEQRYEKKDFKNHRDMGKVRWGDKKGGYGEHYWDLNHAGHAGNKEGDDDYDDSPYNEELQDYPETDKQSDKYEGEEYDPDAADYKKSARPKRENSKQEIRTLQSEKGEEKRRPIKKRSNMDEPIFQRHNKDNRNDFDMDLNKNNIKAQRLKRLHDQFHEGNPESSDIVLVVEHKVKDKYENEEESKRFMPFEEGRRYYNRQVASAAVPRFFLQPITGHVVDTATGQEYLLQPVNVIKIKS